MVVTNTDKMRDNIETVTQSGGSGGGIIDNDGD
jgi:hypothetical protein